MLYNFKLYFTIIFFILSLNFCNDNIISKDTCYDYESENYPLYISERFCRQSLLYLAIVVKNPEDSQINAVLIGCIADLRIRNKCEKLYSLPRFPPKKDKDQTFE